MTIFLMLSPYWGKSFFFFFLTFFRRLFTGFPAGIASDEIQIVVLSFLGISAALLGTFLQLRKMVMLANSLSHTLLLGVVFSYSLLGPHLTFLHLILAAFVMAIITTFATQLLHRFFSLQEDASIGLVFTTLFALGIISVTLFMKNVHLGMESLLGNVDMLSLSDARASGILLVALLGLLFFTYAPMKILCFDESLAKTLGISTAFFHYFLMLALSFLAVTAFKAVGVILILSFLIIPYLIARLFFCRLRTILYTAPMIGVLSSLIGVAFSRHLLSYYGLAISTGALVVVVLVFLYVLAYLYEKKASRYFRQYRLRRQTNAASDHKAL